MSKNQKTGQGIFNQLTTVKGCLEAVISRIDLVEVYSAGTPFNKALFHEIEMDLNIATKTIRDITRGNG